MFHVESMHVNFNSINSSFLFHRKVINKEAVIVENSHHLTYIKKTYFTDSQGESPVRVMFDECINPFGIGALLPKNSPLKPAVDSVS